jgi:uncharacterized protein (DUF362 family)
VGTVYDEFVRDLAAWDRRYAARPRDEMIRLFLLALEREEIVSVGYRESLIVQRLGTMPLEPEVRELIRHALLWAWKDEEMHAVYIRGAILKLGSLSLRWRARSHQLMGAVGGWSSSVRQHARWTEAPLSRALASVLTGAGSLLGQVPRDVLKYMQRGPFREFCRFNVDAERTASLCWGRLAELGRDAPGVDAQLIGDFERIQADEERHCRVFEILADALDDDDRLVAGETAGRLAERIGAVGWCFLPREKRTGAVVQSAVGRGGSVWSSRGATPDEKLPLFRRLLSDARLPELLAARARALGKEVRDLRVAIKPSFMLGYHRKDRSVLTDPVLLDELAGFLREQGCHDVTVIEGRNIYDRFYGNRSVREVADYFGIASPRYRVVDACDEQVAHAYFRGMAQYTVSHTWREAEFRISFGKLRSHPIDLAYLTLGNVELLGARCDEFVFAERQAGRETSIMMLLDAFPPHFALLDGYDLAADGLVGVMGCPRPKSPRRLYAGEDPLAVDLVAARHVGVEDPLQSSMLRAAVHWFGDPRAALRVVGCDEAVSPWRSPYHSELSSLLSFLALPVYALASWRGALFVPEMDEAAFPPLRPAGPMMRLGRRGVQLLLGLRHPK